MDIEPEGDNILQRTFLHNMNHHIILGLANNIRIATVTNPPFRVQVI